jgi:hypothetical protein
MTSRMTFWSARLAAIRRVRLGPIPSISSSRCGAFSMTSNTVSLKALTSRWAKVGPIPLMRPEPKYSPCPQPRSVRSRARMSQKIAPHVRDDSPTCHWLECIRRLRWMGAARSTVTRSRCPRALTRRTQKAAVRTMEGDAFDQTG